MKPFLFTLNAPRFAGGGEREGGKEREREGKKERKGVCVCVRGVKPYCSIFSSFLGHAGRAGYIPCMRF